MVFPLMQSRVNPYSDHVQGKANEPITVAGLLDNSKKILGPLYEGGHLIGHSKKLFIVWKRMHRELQLLEDLLIIRLILWII